MNNLVQALQAFDGKHTEPLQKLAAGTPTTSANIRKLLALAEYDERLVRCGATWVLKRWHESGVEFSPEVVADLVQLLGQETEWDSQLHMLQMLAELDVPKDCGRTLKAVVVRLAESPNKMVRAWRVSAMVRLADQHPNHRRAAMEVLAQADEDQAAAVRARLRQLRKRYAWTRVD